jgi:hypothetical protein
MQCRRRRAGGIATYRLCCVAKKIAISELLLTAAGGAGKDDSVLSIGWQWTVGAGLKCGERERNPRRGGHGGVSEVCMEREVRKAVVMGFLVMTRGREGEEGQKAGCYSLSRTPADGVVYGLTYRHLLLYPLLQLHDWTLLRSPIQLPKLACSRCFASVHQPQGNATTARRSVASSQTRVERSRPSAYRRSSF